MLLTLKRTKTKDYTIGILTAEDKIFFTLELPWKDNKRNISCIPEGLYKIVKHKSPKFGDCLYLPDVPNRSEILVHSGNSVRDFVDSTGYKWKCESQGCLLLASQISNEGVGYKSKDALKSLLSLLKDNEEHSLLIK